MPLIVLVWVVFVSVGRGSGILVVWVVLVFNGGSDCDHWWKSYSGGSDGGGRGGEASQHCHGEK